jgi:hypothetical protein
MSTIDMNALVTLTNRVASLNKQISMTADPSAKAMLSAELAVTTDELTATATHQQAQADASANLMNAFGLMATLTSVVGTSAPTIIGLFNRG